MQCKECQVPVPWGHVAVKIWGQEENPAVLVIHGILDNAGAFDRLIALLPDTFCYYCMDLPGHGKSSHWPPHTIIHSLDNLLAYRAVTDHFRRDKYIILGHSWGAQIGFVFTQLYPERIAKLCMLDAISLFPVSSGQFAQYFRSTHDFYFRMMDTLAKKAPPEYTYEQMLDKLMTQRRYGEINQPAAEALIQRNMLVTEKGNFRFASDPRLKSVTNPPCDIRYTIDLWKKETIQCPVLMIIASESAQLIQYFKHLVQTFKKRRNFKLVQVEGNHDVHNSYPERVAPHVRAFLLKEIKHKL